MNIGPEFELKINFPGVREKVVYCQRFEVFRNPYYRVVLNKNIINPPVFLFYEIKKEGSMLFSFKLGNGKDQLREYLEAELEVKLRDQLAGSQLPS